MSEPTTAPSNPKKVWRRLSVLQRNVIIRAADDPDGAIRGSIRTSALDGLVAEGLVNGRNITELGRLVADRKPA